MRVLWAGFLLGGLLLTGMSIYDQREAGRAQAEGATEVESVVTGSEDGTPWPPPDPTPRPPRLQ